ncbi:MAG: dTMP kinase [Clostridiales bacterium]|nr:dTMP kinase [Clostridiales bacterium]MDD7366690.1 dTMP kinase [Clostridiales bacterium]
MKYDTVIFDLDGTLTESEPGITKSVQYALEQMNRPPLDAATLRRFIGPPLRESFIAVAGMAEDEADEAVRIYRERFSTVGWMENSVYEGIAPLLRALKAGGAYVAIATGKPEVFSRKIIDYFGLAPYIDRLEAITLSDHHADKVALVRRALPERYERACMVGDRAGDMEGALGNGIDGIGALYGYGTREELENAGARFIAASVNALRDILLDAGDAPGGLFVTFEGTDGCGKTTQMKRAADWLRGRGYEVVSTREPGGCPISERIREIILDVGSAGMTAECEAMLYAAARAQHVSEVIKPAVKRGAIVLCDRFLDSSLVYQGVGRGLGMGAVRALNRLGVDGCQPDLTLFYDISPERAMQRRRAASEPDRLELERKEFFEAVYGAYKALAAEDPERIAVIDADRPIDAVETDTRRCLAETLDRPARR